MKKIIFIIALIITYCNVFGQDSDSAKYIWYRYQFGVRQDRLQTDKVNEIPRDTTFSKFGTARKGSILYVGNGVKWTAVGNIVTVYYGIDSITYSNNLLCQWKNGTSVCYTVISANNPGGGIDSVTSVTDSLCFWKSGAATCYAINGTILSTGIDSVTVVGTQLCQFKAGVQTCYTISNVINNFSGIDTAYAVSSDSLRFNKGGNHFFVLFDTTVDLSTVVKYGDVYLDPIWSKIDSIHIYTGDGFDSIFQYRNGDSSLRGLIYKPDGLISGGIVTWSGTGLIFDVSAAVYQINNVIYTSPAATVTLTAADGSNDRYDVIVVNASDPGAADKVTGTASVNPGIPQIDDSSQLALATYLISAGATTPTGVSEVVIYNENTGDPEWPGTAANVTTNFAQTINVLVGTKTTDAGAWTNGTGRTITYTKASGTLTATDYSTLKLWVRLKANLSNTAGIGVTLLNGTTTVSNTLQLNAFGMVKNVTGIYQNISISFNKFNFRSATFNKIRFNLSGANASGFYMDYIVLQSGNTQITNPINPYPVSFAKNSTRDSSILILSNGTRFAVKDSIGGAGSRFGIEDNTGVQDRAMDMDQFGIGIDNSNYFYATAITANNDISAQVTTDVSNPANQSASLGYLRVSTGNNTNVQIDSFGVSILQGRSGNVLPPIIFPIYHTAPSSIGNAFYYSPLTVNGIAADSTGNVNTTGGGGTGNDSAYVNISTPPADTSLIFTRDNNSPDTIQYVVRNNNQLNEISVGYPASIFDGAAIFTRSQRQSLFAPSNQSLMIDTAGRGICFSAWVKLYQNDSAQVIASKDDDLTVAGTEYFMGFYPAYGSFIFQIETNTTTRYVVSTVGTPTINTWYYVEGRYDQTNTKIYVRVNNTLDSLDFAETTFHNTNTPFTVGSDANFYSSTTNGWLNGEIKNLRYFKRPLTAAEGNIFYNSGTPLPYTSIPNSLLNDPLFISSWDFLDRYNIGADSR